MPKVTTKKVLNWPEGHRECKQCLQILPLTSFHRHRQCALGYNSVCKICRKPLSRKQWEEKPIIQKMLERCKSRAIKDTLEFNLTEEDIIIPRACPVFNVVFIIGENNWGPSVDRIDPTKGYVKGNIQIISNKANRMKSDATQNELRAFATWIKKQYGEI